MTHKTTLFSIGTEWVDEDGEVGSETNQVCENLVWGDFCQGGLSIFSSLRVSLFDLASRFFAPTHNRVEPARTEAVKDGARVSSATPQGPWSLTGSSTTARLLSSG